MWSGRLKSFKDAFRGIGYTIRTQQNAQIHLTLMIAAIALGVYFGISATEWGLIFLATGLVLGAETLNTAIEELTNLVSPDYHPLAGRAKDVAAGGVLICAICAAIIGAIIFIPRFLALIFP